MAKVAVKVNHYTSLSSLSMILDLLDFLMLVYYWITIFFLVMQLWINIVSCPQQHARAQLNTALNVGKVHALHVIVHELAARDYIYVVWHIRI